MMLRNLVYILQSEGYDLPRFVRFVYVHPRWWKLERRQSIRWTAKARVVWVTSAAIFWIIAWRYLAHFGFLGLWIVPALVSILPLIIAGSVILVWPFDAFLKQWKMAAASRILRRSGVTVVGITGSYGKTSTKEILSTILEGRFSVIRTPENVNTGIGIAEFVLGHCEKFGEGGIFVVEMGAHRRGDIAAICRMVRPEHSILTGINESHLERFGNLGNIVKTKFELPRYTARLSVLNFDDDNVRKHAGRFAIRNAHGVSGGEVRNVRPKDGFRGLEFEWEGRLFETMLLAEHNVTLIVLCAHLARELSLSVDEIASAVRKICPVPHRLQPIFNPHTEITVIDDSYNGNMNGVRSGIHLLGRATGRKVVLTPGLVELGSKMRERHLEIGELYARSVDLVLLIRSPMTDALVEGMERRGFGEYRIYNDTEEAHNDLGNVLRQGDTILFQNDLTDNYF